MNDPEYVNDYWHDCWDNYDHLKLVNPTYLFNDSACTIYLVERGPSLNFHVAVLERVEKPGPW